MSDKAPYITFYILAALFVASSLVARRLPIGQAVKMALAWLAIFVVAVAIAVALRAYGLL